MVVLDGWVGGTGMVLVLPFTSSSSTVVLLLSDDSCQQRSKNKSQFGFNRDVTHALELDTQVHGGEGGRHTTNTTMIDQLKHKPARGYIGGHVAPSENIRPVRVDVESH